MMKKLFAGLLSLITIGAMLFSGIPTTIHAVNETAIPVADAIKIVGEDATKRGMYEKHFLMSDGSYTVTVYNEPVHQDVNGTWVEVDNTLQLTTDARGVSQYKTVNGITEVSFAKQFDAELVTMKQGEYSLSWDITAVSGKSNRLSTTRVDAKIVPLSLSGLSAEEVKTVASKSTSTIRYDNALAQGVDLEYIVTPSKVKENIILNSPKDITGYRINLYTENLSARLLANNQIELYDADGKVIFTIHSPYMYDSAGELSEDFTLQILPSGTGCYAISMKPNADWLSDPSRVYPVVIDPTVAPSNATSNIIDNYVMNLHDVQNPNLDRLYIGIRGNYFARAYLRFAQMPYIPAGSHITTATMRLNLLAGTSTANNINAYKVTECSWSAATLNYQNKPDATELIASNISHNNKTNYNFSCITAVRSWYRNSPTGMNANYGFMFRYANETIDDYNSVYSGDCSVTANRPSLTINYLTLDGSGEEIVWPLPGYYYANSPFGYRNYDHEMHYGIDIQCEEGATVLAAISGRVTCVDTEDDSDLGCNITIQKIGTSFQVLYFHLQVGSINVQEGDFVTAGVIIARAGSTGNSSGNHLHFQLQDTNDTRLFNPLEHYHPDDSRYNELINPNPMFIYQNNQYIPNNNFDYTYVSSEYNEIYNTPNG